MVLPIKWIQICMQTYCKRMERQSYFSEHKFCSEVAIVPPGILHTDYKYICTYLRQEKQHIASMNRHFLRMPSEVITFQGINF